MYMYTGYMYQNIFFSNFCLSVRLAVCLFRLISEFYMTSCVNFVKYVPPVAVPFLSCEVDMLAKSITSLFFDLKFNTFVMLNLHHQINRFIGIIAKILSSFLGNSFPREQVGIKTYLMKYVSFLFVCYVFFSTAFSSYSSVGKNTLSHL